MGGKRVRNVCKQLGLGNNGSVTINRANRGSSSIMSSWNIGGIRIWAHWRTHRVRKRLKDTTINYSRHNHDKKRWPPLFFDSFCTQLSASPLPLVAVFRPPSPRSSHRAIPAAPPPSGFFQFSGRAFPPQPRQRHPLPFVPIQKSWVRKIQAIVN
ncbi:hypothetical protein POM88_015625 [Heracleum sosnowskyi]|uniref:Uncharacterized protein n=1 Tax=Heracleum sosnowskyi TaxID=360622 RepID=A0AAD8IN82_9APIA|nr:hypothetical protein POM88_015625 [Heracleum sosnowskyi]